MREADIETMILTVMTSDFLSKLADRWQNILTDILFIGGEGGSGEEEEEEEQFCGSFSFLSVQ